MELLQSIAFVVLMLLGVNQRLSLQEMHSYNKEQLQKSLQHYIATYFGGSALESCWGITLDDEGNVFVTGLTTSANFPSTTNAYNSTPKGKGDVFILKFDKELRTVLASAIIGGSEDDCGYSILFDKRGYVYVAGYTSSKDFPTTPSAYCTTYQGGEGDAFILKMDRALTTLVASTFLGGSGDEVDWYSAEIISDPKGDLYIAGNTSSTDFPTTHGTYSERYNGGSKDAFISKFDSDLKHLLASTFLGGNKEDRIERSLSLDTKTNELCVAGITFSSNFPTSKNAYSSTISGKLDGFITKLTTDLSSVTASTILPQGWIYCMFIHDCGDIYVGGHAGNGLPTTPRAYYRTFEKHSDEGFLSRFSNDLTTLKSSTVLPGTGTPQTGGEIIALNIAQNHKGDIISVGWAKPRDFPSTPGSFDETLNGGNDTFVLKMTGDLSTLLASAFIGGSKDERWNRMTTDGEGNIYIASYTQSTDFPTTVGSACMKFNGGGNDGFAVRIGEDLSALIPEKFHDAAKRNDLEKVKKMLTGHGALLEKTDAYKRTALHSAARYGAESVTRYLIEKGANLDARDENGNTPLQLATLFSHDTTVEIIVKKTKNINGMNDDGSTPLLLATMYGTPRSIGLLLSNNANAAIKDKEGNSPLHIAASYGRADKAQELLKFKAAVDAQNNAGNTPLHVAVRKAENSKVIEILLDHDASLSIPDSAGKCALHFASTSSIPLLLKRGASINTQDRDGNTPLHITYMSILRFKSFPPPFKEKVLMLLQNGADPNIKNKSGKTATDLATESGVQDAIEILRN